MSNKPKILLVEDEPHLAFNLRFNLEQEGYEVIHVATGTDAIETFRKDKPFNAILLDVMLPHMDGFEVAMSIRSEDSKVAILMLTARASDTDRVKGLEAGVDDYITKPFHLKELLLKVKRAVDRSFMIMRGAESGDFEQQIIRCGPFSLNTEALELKCESTSHAITALESDVLKQFFLNPMRVLSREHLLKTAWGMSGTVETRTVDNFIARLRKYLEKDPKRPRFLISVRGRGYQLVVEQDHVPPV